MGKRRQWLELIELGLLPATLVTIIWSFFSGIWQTPAIFLWLTLALNTFNCLNAQRRQRRQALGAIKRLDANIQTQVRQLSQQVSRGSDIKTSIAKLNTKEEMQDYLGSLEKSLTNVVQYLNEEALDERLKNLEQTLLILQQEGKLASINTPLPTTSGDIPAQETSSTVNDPWAAKPEPIPEKPAIPQQSWQCIKVLDAHKDCVSALSFSDDQRLLASGSWDQDLKIWQVSDGKQLARIRAHRQGILDLCFMDGFMDRLLGGFLDGESKPYAIASSSFEPDVKLWHFNNDSSDSAELKLHHNLQGHDGAVYALTGNADGDLLTTGHDQQICRWNLKDGSLIQSVQDKDDQIQAIAAAPGGDVFITAGKEGLLKFWRTEDQELIGSLGSDQPDSIQAIAIRADGELFASGGESGKLYLWQLDLNGLSGLPETVPCFSLPAHDKAITEILFSQQGNYLVTGCVDGTVRIWQIGVNTPLATLQLSDPAQESHTRLLSLAQNADGTLLAAGSSDGKIKIWMQQ